jgi:hypothetical protein
MPQKKSYSKGFSKPVLITALAVGVVLVAGAIAFYLVLVRAPAEIAGNVAEEFREFFNFTPRVTIDQTVVIEQSNPIMEVSTLSRNLFVEDRWEDQWVGSTKTVEIRGSFTLKAGFDLKEPFTINITRYGLAIQAGLPEPRILSLEMNTYDIIKDENGWWNRVSDQDREEAFYRLRTAARKAAEDSGILEEARATAEERIREIVQRNGSTVEFWSPLED